MSEIQVKKINIEELKPWEKNPRKHGSDIDNIVRSIEKFGWTNPVLVQKGTMRVIAGHGRIEAAKKRGMTEIPIIELELNDKDAEAYTIADNRLAELSQWNIPLLVEELNGMDNELRNTTGFDDSSFEKMLKDMDENDPKPEVEFTEELMESHNYVVLYFDNEMDWTQLQTLYPLKTVKALDSKPGFEKQGVGRVVKGIDFINTLLSNK